MYEYNKNKWSKILYLHQATRVIGPGRLEAVSLWVSVAQGRSRVVYCSSSGPLAGPVVFSCHGYSSLFYPIKAHGLILFAANGRTQFVVSDVNGCR